MAAIPVQIKLLPHGEGITLPEYQSEHAAGMDIHAALSEDVIIEPGEIAIIPTGFIMAVPVGHEAQIRPRSGLSIKHGITVPNSPGTIDADYRGEVKVALVNISQVAFTITPNMRIAQMLIKPIYRTQWEVVNELDETARGEGGFGHTGTH